MLPKATLLMRIVVIIIGLVVLMFSIFLFPEISREVSLIAKEAAEHVSPWLAFVHVPFLLALYVAAIFFFLVLYQALKLLGLIDKKNAFSDLSVKALKGIKICCLVICALYMVGIMPMVYCVAEFDDAPGLILIGFAIGLVPVVVSTLAAILQTLLQEAIGMKAENDLTV